MEIGRLSKEGGFLRRVCILGSSFLSFLSLKATHVLPELIVQALSMESYKERSLHMHSELKWGKQKLHAQTSARSWVGTFLSSYITQFLISMASLVRLLLLLLLKEQSLSHSVFIAHPGPLTQRHKMLHLRNCKCL